MQAHEEGAGLDIGDLVGEEVGDGIGDLVGGDGVWVAYWPESREKRFNVDWGELGGGCCCLRRHGGQFELKSRSWSGISGKVAWIETVSI